MAEAKRPEKLGRYDIIRELGKGAMGVVYEGKDPNIGRRVAIKTARRDVMEASGMADEMMERFLREAQAAGALNHPNIITIYDADEQDGIAYIAMEFLEGGDLQDLIEKRSRLGEKEIVEIGATVCEALAIAHDQGVIHRDIKPANIIMPVGKPLKVADFGIAHVSDSNLTQEGALIGTPHYMSPEQFMGQKVDGRSDLFSVSVILYEMLTGEKPFTGEALSTVMHHVIKTDPVPPSELNFAVSDAVNQVVLKGMSKRPNDRYQNGRAFAAALRECLKSNPDPHILATGMAPAEATMMGGTLNQGADATVVATGDPGATTVSLQAPGDPTVVKPQAPDDRTMLAPGVADQGDETLRKGPEPSAADSTYTGREVLPTPAQPAWQALAKNKGVLAGVAVVALLMAGALMLFGGDEAPQVGEDTAALPTEKESSGTGTGTPIAKPYFNRIQPQVFGVWDQELWTAYRLGDIGEDEMKGNWDAVNVDLTIYDYDTGEMLKEVKNYNHNNPNDGTIEFEGRPYRLKFTVVYHAKDGSEIKEEYPFEQPATESGQMALMFDNPICLDLSSEPKE